MCLNVDQDYKKYLCYAYQITGCNHLKYDLVNDMFLKIHGILEINPEKEMNNGYIYLTMRSIFLNQNKKYTPEYIEDYDLSIIENECITPERIQVNDVLSSMEFNHREILLRTHEDSLRTVATEIGINHQSVNNYKNKALTKFKELWQKQA